jgi:hypothetical protein
MLIFLQLFLIAHAETWHREEASKALTVAALDLALAATPLLSHCRALYEGASGKHLITGHALDPVTRAIALASCTPMAPHAHHAKMIRDACLSLGRAAAFCQKVQAQAEPNCQSNKHLVVAVPLAAADFLSSHQNGLAQSRFFLETMMQKELVTGAPIQKARGLLPKAVRLVPKWVQRVRTSSVGVPSKVIPRATF